MMWFNVVLALNEHNDLYVLFIVYVTFAISAPQDDTVYSCLKNMKQNKFFSLQETYYAQYHNDLLIFRVQDPAN